MEWGGEKKILKENMRDENLRKNLFYILVGLGIFVSVYSNNS